jgi:nitrous oxide reductase accessory protein NosL
VIERVDLCDRSRRRALLGVLLFPPALIALFAPAGEGGEGAPGPIALKPSDRCPVCGMFVAKYPDWIAQAIYRDGSYAVFDGAKDLFKYLFNLPTYAPTKRAADIAALYVTDYYSLTLVDGRAAWYVVGSDVLGPMGRELIPLAAEKDARQFMADHKGKRLLRFAEVTADILKGLG